MVYLDLLTNKIGEVTAAIAVLQRNSWLNTLLCSQINNIHGGIIMIFTANNEIHACIILTRNNNKPRERWQAHKLRRQ